MAFKLGNIVVDRVQYGVAENFNDELVYVLDQLMDVSINVTAESKDATDAQGTLIKRFFMGKTGELSANHAIVSLGLMNAQAGDTAAYASEDSMIAMPKIITVKAGTTVTLKNVVDGSIMVNALDPNGAMGMAYTMGTAASETEFGFDGETGVFTPPTDANETQFIVKYTRNVASGVVIKNKANVFPKTVRLTLRVLAIDPCKPDTLRAGYVYIPSFQLSPDVELTLDTESQQAYNGTLQVDFCSADKTLYEFYWADEDEDEE